MYVGETYVSRIKGLVVILVGIILAISIYYYLENAYKPITNVENTTIFKVKVSPYEGGNIEVKDNNVVIAKPSKFKIDERYAYINQFTLKLTPAFNCKNTTIIMYVKLLEHPKGEDHDCVTILPSGILALQGESWYWFGFSLKIGVTYKITLKYPNIAYCEPKPLGRSPYIKPPLKNKVSPRLCYICFNCDATIMIWNITVIVGKS